MLVPDCDSASRNSAFAENSQWEILDRKVVSELFADCTQLRRDGSCVSFRLHLPNSVRSRVLRSL